MAEGAGTTDLWKDGLLKGRTFATNGPLLNFQLSGEMVGEELAFNAPQTAVPFSAKLRSIVPANNLELVCKGRIVKELKREQKRYPADRSSPTPQSESVVDVSQTLN